MFFTQKNNLELHKEKLKFKHLHEKAKILYIWDYYKFPIVILCIVIYILGFTIYRNFTQKSVLLSAALVNVAPDDSLMEQLRNGYITTQDIDSSQYEVRLYTGLYLTNNENDPNHEYTYASRMKILGAIDSEALDIVFMNKEAFDAFAQNGYLCNLDELLSKTDEKLYQKLSKYLQTNMVILEDNSMDLYFDDSITYSAKTEEYPMALDISQFPCIKNANMNGNIYLGIITNSPHISESVNYIDYLFENN